MESDLNKQHPFIQLLSTLDEKGVIVTDSVKGVPINEESYISSDMLIILCHQGTMCVNDSPQLTFKAHDVAILLPDQLGFSQWPTADYCTTWIAMTACNTPIPIPAMRPAIAAIRLPPFPTCNTKACAMRLNCCDPLHSRRAFTVMKCFAI